MVDITNCTEPCFAETFGGCKILTTSCNRQGCGFYKPQSCADWVRIEKGGKVYLLPPEEYYTKEDYNAVLYMRSRI